MVEDISHPRWIERGTILRCFGPAGFYWRDSFASATAAYVVEEDLIFSACHFDDEPHKGDFYSEYDEPKVDELRLLAALMLPIGWHCGMLVVYPLHPSLVIDEQADLKSPTVVEAYSRLIKDKLNDDRRSWTFDPMPPVFGGREYRYRDIDSPSGMQHRIFDAVNVSDHLLMMRGVNALMKSAMLQEHAVFGEQAHHSLYIALEASHQLLLRRLRAAGVVNPSSSDAALLLSQAFGEEPTGRKYFEDYYEDRIMTFHPESRFGITPYSPLMNRHFYQLYYDLREIYRWIILGADFGLPST